jgi:hypothetical protein
MSLASDNVDIYDLLLDINIVFSRRVRSLPNLSATVSYTIHNRIEDRHRSSLVRPEASDAVGVLSRP